MAVTGMCVNHPQRVAAGVCRSCSATICNECITKVEGINLCVGCLEKKARRSDGSGRVQTQPSSVARVGLFVLGVIALSGVLYLYGLLLDSLS